MTVTQNRLKELARAAQSRALDATDSFAITEHNDTAAALEELHEFRRKLHEAVSHPPATAVVLHPATRDLVERFAAALTSKLAAAEAKYGYSDGWSRSDWMDECRAKLAEHVAKGDPRDVAAYCAFLWHHGEPTARAAGTAS